MGRRKCVISVEQPIHLALWLRTLNANGDYSPYTVSWTDREFTNPPFRADIGDGDSLTSSPR
jgi:hypothetical protein